MRKSLLYYLFSKNKKPLYVDDNGHVQEGTEDYKKQDGQPACLEYSPDGWKDTLVKYARNVTYWGLFRSYTAPMKFVKDGAKILHQIRWTLGREALIYFGIMRLNRTQLPYNYEAAYLAEINLAKYKRNGRGVSVEALEGGMSKLLKAYESTTYEIPIDTDPEHVNVLTDGMEFDFSRTFTIMADQPLYPDENYYHLGITETAREGATRDMQFQDIMPGHPAGTPYPNDSWFSRYDKVLGANPSVDLVIQGTITVYFNYTDVFYLNAVVNDGATFGGTTEYTLVSASNAGNAGETKTYSFSRTIPLPFDYRAHFRMWTGSVTGSDPHITVTGGEVSVKYVYRHKESYTKGLYPFRVLEKLGYKMSEGKYGVKSDWLEPLRNIVITSGDAARGIVTDTSDPANPIKGAVIKSSLMDFFKAMNRWGAGLTIEGNRPNVDDKLVIEPMSYFFRSDIIMNLGEVSKAELTEAEDIIFNTIKAGYDKKDYTDANGKYEMNQGQQWTTPGQKIVRELDLRSPYRADAFGFELLRINFDNKKTTDSDSDNDTFMLQVNDKADTEQVLLSFIASGNYIVFPASPRMVVGQKFIITGTANNNETYTVTAVDVLSTTQTVYTDKTITTSEVAVTGTLNWLTGKVVTLYRPAYTAVSGLPHWETAFNTELTPKKSLLANGAFIRSIMDLMDTESIKFQSADKNSDFSTTLNGVTVLEKEDIQIGSLPAPLFRPAYITFTTKVPVNVMAVLKQNPYGKIKFTVEGETFYGYLVDGGVKLGIEDTQVWKVLSAPENNLLKFNNVS